MRRCSRHASHLVVGARRLLCLARPRAAEPPLDADGSRRVGATRWAMIEILAIRLAGGRGHEHVTDLLWRGASTRAFAGRSVGQSTTQGLVDWLSSRAGNRAVVDDGSRYLQVLVVRLADRAPHLRARSEAEWTDTLLALPSF
jgi:hypothetical protein